MIINVCGKSQVVFFFFLHGDSRQGKVASEATTVGLFCLSDPVRLKDSVISNKTGKNQCTFNLLHGDDHQGKVELKTTTLV